MRTRESGPGTSIATTWCTPEAEGNLQHCDLPGPVESAERAVGRGNYRWLPARCRQRSRQVAYDVANSANLAAGERRILGGNKDYLLVRDN